MLRSLIGNTFRSHLGRLAFSNYSFSRKFANSKVIRTSFVRYYSINNDEVLQVKLTVVGVGGGGCNVVNNMISKDLTDIHLIVANTDAQCLANSLCPSEDRIQLGKDLTHGLGAGANPTVGKKAAEESLESVLDRVGPANMCFITAGMGGGTGTGAAPVIAKALRDRNILTVGMVSVPFRFEGKRRMNIAKEGLKAMQESVDTLIVVPNERVAELANKTRAPLRNAFDMVDNVLYEGMKAVTDVIIKPGLINLDFADVRTITKGPGWGIMGTGFATGKDKAIEATQIALNNPLLAHTNIDNATGVLVSIAGGTDLDILEVDEVLRIIRERVSEDANIIFGATTDESLKGTIRVSLILTGPFPPEDAETELLNNQDQQQSQTHQAQPQRESQTQVQAKSQTQQAKQNEAAPPPLPKDSQPSQPVTSNTRFVQSIAKTKETTKQQEQTKQQENTENNNEPKKSWWDSGRWF